jgi:hypothetical protein
MFVRDLDRQPATIIRALSSPRHQDAAPAGRSPVPDPTIDKPLRRFCESTTP